MSLYSTTAPAEPTGTSNEMSKKVRVQVDLSETEATLLQHLVSRLSVRSRADLLQQAFGTFLWIVNEVMAGRRIISVTPETAQTIAQYKELSVAAVEPLRFNHYEFLTSQPDSNYKQYYLKGRNMRVGQLIYKMRANGLSAEEAAIDMDLPLRQVREAQVYYEINRDLIEREAEEEAVRLQEAGVNLEPEDLS